MTPADVVLWVGVAQVVGGLSFGLLMDWLRERPVWPPPGSWLRSEVWVMLGLTLACLGVAGIGFAVLAG